MKKRNLTRSEFEKQLNQDYADIYNWDEVKDNFSHMVKRESTLHNYFRNQQLGTLQRKQDPISFNAAFNEQNIKR
jgi:hypothetical protein